MSGHATPATVCTLCLSLRAHHLPQGAQGNYRMCKLNANQVEITSEDPVGVGCRATRS
jgi:hypothetical protein